MTDTPHTAVSAPGSWVEVLPEHDIPAIFRDNKPTRGRVQTIKDGVAEVWVPIGDADVDEHSQSVPYPLDALRAVTIRGQGCGTPIGTKGEETRCGQGGICPACWRKPFGPGIGGYGGES